jgi:NADH-quinone oxidoreductase subunit N
MEPSFLDASLFLLNEEQWKALLPYLWLCFGLALSIVYAGYRGSRNLGKVISTIVFLPFAYFQATHLGEAPQSIFGASLEIDTLTRIVGASVSIFAAVTSWFSSSSDDDEVHPEWLPLLVLSVLGLSLLPGARDFISFFVYLETLAISGYILTSLDTKRTGSLEAGFKYLIMGAFSSAIFLMGVTLIYGLTGSFDFEKIALVVKTVQGNDPGFLVAGGILLISALMFKVALVPFHMWSPDVYQAAPTSVAAFMATATKISIFSATAVVLSQTGILSVNGIQGYIYVLAVLSVLIGSFLAVAQTHLRRLFAYSGIVNAGYAGLALAAGSSAAGSMVTGLVIYGATLIAVFSVIEIFALNLGKSPNSDVELKELSLAARKSHPMTLAVFAFAIFSIAGIPPLPGFFGKYLVLKDLWNAGFQNGVYVMLIGTMLGLAYYLKLFIPLYMSDDSGEKIPTKFGGVLGVVGVVGLVISLLILTGLNRLPSWVQSIEAVAR